MKKVFKLSVLSFVLLAGIVLPAPAQSNNKKNERPKETAQTPPVPEPTPASTETPKSDVKVPTKRNERPDSATNQDAKNGAQPDKNSLAALPKAGSYPYRYEFSQPNFIVHHVIIEHDDTGKGTITFERKDMDEPATDPIQVSASSLERINGLFTTLNFLDSTEEYQSPMRDYGHLGSFEITLKKDGKERKVKYNWSENATARDLSHEYRRLTEQAVWLFEISVARENQPLEAPTLMDRLDSLIKRNEISDPTQLVARLKELSTDERIPLIARNHATRIVKEIEKKK